MGFGPILHVITTLSQQQTTLSKKCCKGARRSGVRRSAVRSCDLLENKLETELKLAAVLRG